MLHIKRKNNEWVTIFEDGEPAIHIQVKADGLCLDADRQRFLILRGKHDKLPIRTRPQAAPQIAFKRMMWKFTRETGDIIQEARRRAYHESSRDERIRKRNEELAADKRSGKNSKG